jgi:hypothetical protein
MNFLDFSQHGALDHGVVISVIVTMRNHAERA